MALVLEFNPAFAHIHQLKGGVMQVRFANLWFIWHRTYDMRHDLPGRGLLNAQIPVFKKGPQAPSELGIACMGDCERQSSHGWPRLMGLLGGTAP